MLDYITVPQVFIKLLYHFGMIYGTNLLTRCPVPVPVFCCLFVSEKVFWEVSRIALKIYENYFQYETKTKPEGGPQPSDASQARTRAWPHLGPTWTGGPPPRVALSPINCPRRKTPKKADHIFQKTSEAAAISSPILGGFCNSSRQPERGIDTGGIYTTMPASGVMRE